MPERDHAKAVEVWLAKCDCDDDTEKLVRLFCQTFNAIWKRAQRTLGETTLTAIGDRALHYAAERHPQLKSFVLELDGIRCVDPTMVNGLPTRVLAAAITDTLTEYLTVLGALTAEILTSALHAELTAPEPNSPGAAKKEPSL